LGTIPSGSYIAGQTIYSNGTVEESSDVIFDTTENILLDAGFEVPLSTTIEILIGAGCQGSND